jgi:hypothetical protein
VLRTTLTQTWHFQSDITASLNDGALTAVAKPKRIMTMKQATASNLTTNVARGTTSPVDGWYSEKYEIKATNASAITLDANWGDLAVVATSGNDTRTIHIHALAAGGESVTVTP